MEDNTNEFDIKISLNNVRNVKTLYIDGIGGFTVRKLGAGEELDLSSKLRRLGAILKEMSSIDFTKYDSTKEADVKALEKISKRAEDLTKEVNDINRFELETYKKCFTDDNGGKNVDMLLNSLSVEDRSNLFKRIFDPIKVLDEPDTVKKVQESSENEPEKVENTEKESENV